MRMLKGTWSTFYQSPLVLRVSINSCTCTHSVNTDAEEEMHRQRIRFFYLDAYIYGLVGILRIKRALPLNIKKYLGMKYYLCYEDYTIIHYYKLPVVS